MKNEHMDSETAPLFSLSMLGKRKKKIKQTENEKPSKHKLAHQIDIFVSMVSVVSMVMETLFGFMESNCMSS